MSQAQKEHTNKLLDSMCTNIKNDTETLNLCIKTLRKHLEEGKHIYAKCNLAHLHLQSFDIQITWKIAKLQVLTKKFLKPDQKLANFEKDMEAIHTTIRNIEVEKDRVLKKFILLKDHVSPQITLLENYIEECLVSKASYDQFLVTDLSTTELATYALCALISVSEKIKDSW